jgi:outer membrane protein TolC
MGLRPIGASRVARRRRLCLLCVALAWGAACAGPRLDARYRELRDGVSHAAAPLPERGAAFALEGAPALERAALVREVLRRNPTLAAARAAVEEALARYPQDSSLPDPMLGYAVGPRSFGTSAVDDAHRVELSQALLWPGKRRLRGESALALAEAADGDLAALRLGLALETSLLLDDYWAAARALEINAQHLALLDELRTVALARYEAGLASQQDPLQAETEIAELLHVEVGIRSELRGVQQRLNALLHRDPGAELPPPPPHLALPPPAEDAEAYLAVALAQRPELRAADQRLAAREASLALAEREFLPDFTLVGGWDGFWQEPELQSFVGLEVNVPLRLARRRGALDEARAALARSRAERERVEDGIRLAVHGAAVRLAEAHHLLVIVRDRRLPASRDRVAAARAGFETGRDDFLALVEAERSLRDAELGLEQARADVSRRFAELEAAAGRIPGLPEGGQP